MEIASRTPFLLSLANIRSEVASKASSNAFIMTALLPVPKFLCAKKLRGIMEKRLLHQCLDIICGPLKLAARDGAPFSTSDGNLIMAHTPLVSYIVDTPEAADLSGVKGKTSHLTMASHKTFGDSVRHPERTGASTWDAICSLNARVSPDDVAAYQKAAKAHPNRLSGVHLPFWRDWPLSTDPSKFLTPEVLHHIHKAFFDHDFQWGRTILGDAEIDFRLSLLHPAFRDSTLDLMEALLARFHELKHHIIEANGREQDHFNIPKLELLHSIVPSVRWAGVPMQYTADITEKAHSTQIKVPARTETNHRDYDPQIVRHLDRAEKLRLFTLYTNARAEQVELDLDNPDEGEDEEDATGSSLAGGPCPHGRGSWWHVCALKLSRAAATLRLAVPRIPCASPALSQIPHELLLPGRYASLFPGRAPGISPKPETGLWHLVVRERRRTTTVTTISIPVSTSTDEWISAEVLTEKFAHQGDRRAHRSILGTRREKDQQGARVRRGSSLLLHIFNHFSRRTSLTRTSTRSPPRTTSRFAKPSFPRFFLALREPHFRPNPHNSQVRPPLRRHRQPGYRFALFGVQGTDEVYFDELQALYDIRHLVAIAASNPEFPVAPQWTGRHAGGRHSYEDFHQQHLALASLTDTKYRGSPRRNTAGRVRLHRYLDDARVELEICLADGEALRMGNVREQEEVLAQLTRSSGARRGRWFTRNSSITWVEPMADLNGGRELPDLADITGHIHSQCYASNFRSEFPTLESYDDLAELSRLQGVVDAGIRHVSFKPGSVEGIRQVVAIAASNPDFPVILQWTDGRAGGHHSYEDFHQPVLQTYRSIRQPSNISLVGGSGFGAAEDVWPYLTCEWALKYETQTMPLDGFLFASRVTRRLCYVSVVAHTSLDDPLPFIEAFFKEYPTATKQLLAAEDSAYFHAISQRPGQKPVPFILVLDATFEVWFKNDSLWAAKNIEAVFDQDPQRAFAFCKEMLGNIHNELVQRLLASKYDNNASKVPTIDYLSAKPTAAPCRSLHPTRRGQQQGHI
ncbi:RPN1-RPN2-N domain-containing protein [Mycena kentingensis (nom. inval.)]|nr:RPN1-RPN2-N domain-containing protein [Mycena kentingensis (nom. inval.)]